MSSYENYSQTSNVYDQTRVPVGVEILLGCLAQSEIPLQHQQLLDAGCGTANYSRALLDKVERITAIDLNSGMLEQARKKFNDEDAQRINFQQLSIEDLPFADETFDGLMINQVLHHLEDNPESGYPRISKLLRGFARVLKPGGVICINTCSQRQIRRGFWYYDLIPDEIESMCKRHIPVDTLKTLISDNDFEYLGSLVPVDAVIQGTAYFNPRGPLDEAWRNGDSMWSTVPESKLIKAQKKLEQLDKDGKLEPYVSDLDLQRQDIGQVTFLHGRRKDH